VVGVEDWPAAPENPKAETAHQQFRWQRNRHSGAISPDGKYLAYADPLGMHVQLIANGDRQTVSQPESLDANAAWTIASWLPDGTSFLANATVPGGSTSIWMVFLIRTSSKKNP
jgi:hypothetical protein